MAFQVVCFSVIEQIESCGGSITQCFACRNSWVQFPVAKPSSIGKDLCLFGEPAGVDRLGMGRQMVCLKWILLNLFNFVLLEGITFQFSCYGKVNLIFYVSLKLPNH